MSNPQSTSPYSRLRPSHAPQRQEITRTPGLTGDIPPTRPSRAVRMTIKPMSRVLNPLVRKLAGKTLGLFGAQALGPLFPETVKALTQGLTDTSAEFREYAARALGQLGAGEAIPALQKATQDSDARTRAAAAEALQRIASPESEKKGR